MIECGLTPCAIEHELSHIEDMMPLGGSTICWFRQKGAVVGFADPEMDRQSERKAYRKSLNCLIQLAMSMQIPKCEDDDCLTLVFHNIEIHYKAWIANGG